MDFSLFHWLFLAGFTLGVIMRKADARRSEWDQRQSFKGEGILVLTGMALWGIAQIMVLIYLFSDWLAAANYPLIPAVQWAGMVLFYLGVYYLWASHAHLAGNWSPLSRPKNDATVPVTTGVYRRMRHPMYTAHVLWSLGTALVLGNWLAGPLGLLGMLAIVFVRIPREEAALIEKFGQDYRSYMDRTWGVRPKLAGMPRG